MEGELRCASRIHGIMTDEDLLEIKCHSKKCGAGNGTVVLHYFDPATNELVRTSKFRNPSTAFQHKEEQRA